MEDDTIKLKKKEHLDSLFPLLKNNNNLYEDLEKDIVNFKDSFYLLKATTSNMNNKTKNQMNKLKPLGKINFLEYKKNINKKQSNYPSRKNQLFPSIKNCHFIDNETFPKNNISKSPKINCNSIDLYELKSSTNITKLLPSINNNFNSNKTTIQNESLKTINNPNSNSQKIIMNTTENIKPNNNLIISQKDSNRSTCLNYNNNKSNITYFNNSNHRRVKTENLDEIRNIPKILNNKFKEIKIDQGRCSKMLNKVEKRCNKMDLKMGSKLKYAKWRYQISDFKKYFIDIESFGEKERQELEKRKTFYDLLEDMVDMVNENKMKKKYLEAKIDSINEQIDQDKDKRKNLFEVNFLLMKQKFLKKYLNKLDKRKVNEEKKRNEVNKILFDSELNARKALSIKIRK